MTKSSRLSYLIAFVFLVVYAMATVVIVPMLRTPKSMPPPFSQSVAEGKAEVLDTAFGFWKKALTDVAKRTTALLGQLDDLKISSAAEGTLMLFLQRELKFNPRMGELAIVDLRGKVVVSTDGTRVGKIVDPNVNMSNKLRTRMLLSSRGPALRQTISTNFLLAGWLHPKWLEGLLRPNSAGGSLMLLDANGNTFSALADGTEAQRGSERPLSAAVLAVGSESQSGQLTVGGLDIGYAPLAHARIVVLAIGEKETTPCFWKSWGWYLGAGIVTSALLLTMLFGRLFRIRR